SFFPNATASRSLRIGLFSGVEVVVGIDELAAIARLKASLAPGVGCGEIGNLSQSGKSAGFISIFSRAPSSFVRFARISPGARAAGRRACLRQSRPWTENM